MGQLDTGLYTQMNPVRLSPMPIKGLQGYDIELLWEALKHGANDQLKGTASGRVKLKRTTYWDMYPTISV